jgi:hypothetical protein
MKPEQIIQLLEQCNKQLKKNTGSARSLDLARKCRNMILKTKKQ